MTTVGEVNVKLAFDTKQISSQQNTITKEVESKWSKVGSKVGSIAASAGKVAAAGFAAAGAAVVAVGKQAVESYANYEQLVGGVDTLFKDSSAKVQEYAANAFKTAGMSANDYMETVTSFSASLLQSVGGDTAKAAEYANTAVTDMSDNANKMGTSIESIQYAYQGFAKQNYTMLDNLKLGYGGSKEEMERLIEDANKLREAQGLNADLTIDSYADVVTAIHEVQTNLGITGTTAEEADQTIQGSLSSMQAAWQNLLTGMADPTQDFGALVQNFISSIGTFVQNLLPVIQNALNGFANLITQLAPVITEKLPGLIQAVLPGLLQAALNVVLAIAKNLPSILTGLIDTIVTFLTDPATISALLQAGIELFFALVQAVPQILGSLISAFGKLVGSLWNAIKSMFGEFAGNFGSFITGIFKNAINGVLSFIEGFVNSPIDVLNGFIDVINGAFGAIGVNIGHIDRIGLPRLAQGGLATGATAAIIGEAGQEAVLPLQRNTDNWSGLLADTLLDAMAERGGGKEGGIIVNQTNYINNELDADDIGRRMMNSIRRSAL